MYAIQSNQFKMELDYQCMVFQLIHTRGMTIKTTEYHHGHYTTFMPRSKFMEDNSHSTFERGEMSKVLSYNLRIFFLTVECSLT